MDTDLEVLKKALRKIGKNVETHGMLSPSDFTGEDVSLLYSLGVNLYERGDYVQAKDIFQRLVLSRPHEVRFWQALGATMQMSASYEEALTAYAMGTLIDDKDPSMHFHAAECLYAIGDHQESSKALRNAKERFRDYSGQELFEKIATLETLLRKNVTV